MVGFAGRVRELSELEELYSRDGRKTCAIYGRRRIGKTSLITEFCRGKRSLMFMMAPGSERQNLDAATLSMEEFLGEHRHYENFPEFLRELGDICREEKTVVVMDELPFLLESAPHVAGYIQHFIDILMDGTDSMLIVCGSSVSSMEAEIMNSSRPLYMRFRMKLRVRQMGLEECAAFHRGLSDLDLIKLYLTVGGVPFYHETMEGNTYEECLKRGYLSTNSFLSEETRSMLMELKNPDRCMAILEAISYGAVSLKQISERTSIDKATCRRCLNDMSYFRIVDRVVPMCDSPKHPIYYIREPTVRFQFDVVDRSRVMMTNPDPDWILSKIEHRVSTFLGKRFEDMCQEYVVSNYHCIKVGRCWGRFEDMDRGDVIDGDIDVVAKIDRGDSTVYMFAECKFSRHKVGFTEYNKLDRMVRYLGWDTDYVIALFSISGFDPEFEEFARDNGVLMYGMDEIMGRSPAPEISSVNQVI